MTPEGASAPGNHWAPFVIPFALLIALLGLENTLKLNPGWSYPMRTAAVAVALAAVSRREIKLKPSRPVASLLAGAAVFLVWIGPDALFPGYRSHWLFQNPLTGAAASSVPEAERGSMLFIVSRATGAILVVPIVEELFWRAWLMRRLISPHLSEVPLGTYEVYSFWLTAILFGTEHGAYWDVGILAGIVYNWWMIRTRSLADCILAHAVTNACLAGYVLATGHWEFWL